MHIDDQLLEAAGEGDLVESIRCLKDGAQVDCEDEDGHTPLMNAARAGNLNLVKELVRRGADPDRWAQGDCPLSCAASGGWRPVYEFLQELVSEETCAAVGEEQLEQGERRRRRAEYPETDAFIMAAAQGKLDEVQHALDAGVDVNALGSEGNSALHFAAFYSHVPVVELLLKQGAEVDIRSDEDGPGSSGCTPLAMVVGSFFASERVATIKLLLTAGANLNSHNDAGCTPLMHAITSQMGYPDSVKELIRGGADLDLRDPYGNTPLMIATYQRKQAIVDLLTEAGASTDGLDNALLFNAAYDGDLASVERLLAEGDLDINHRYHETALSAACMQGHAPVVAALIEAGADIDLPRTTTDQCPLILAAEAGHLEVVELLLKAGVNLHAQVPGIGTALDYARQRRKSRPEIVKVLEEAGASSIFD